MEKFNVDYDLLFTQKNELLHARNTGVMPSVKTLDGIINYLEAILDMAEELGAFKYPKSHTDVDCITICEVENSKLLS